MVKAKFTFFQMKVKSVLGQTPKTNKSCFGKSPEALNAVKSTEVSITGFSLNLHVLGTPPAFILSQDQTLILFVSYLHYIYSHTHMKLKSVLIKLSFACAL